MTRLLKIIVSLIFFAGIIFAIFRSTQNNTVKQHEKSYTVETIQPKTENVPILWTSVGTVAPEQSVTVIPQITGTIREILFQEGQFVKAGDMLLLVDPTPFQLNLDNANALLKKDQATLQSLMSITQRDIALYNQKILSPQDYENAVANLKAQAAVVAADQSQVLQAENQLSYTKITAPISGKTGNLNVKAGDVVTANTTVLTTINALNPILVNFSVPQNKLSSVLKYQSHAPLKVKVVTNDEHTFTGVVNFVNNAVDPLSGTVSVKAKLENPAAILWPGQVVTVHLILTIQNNALVIPASALQVDDQGSFVFVNQNNIAKIIRVETGERFNDQVVIVKGLTPQETVLTNVPPNLTDGTPVIITS